MDLRQAGCLNGLTHFRTMLYINHSEAVYMVNILPEIEVRGGLLKTYSEPKVRGIFSANIQ